MGGVSIQELGLSFVKVCMEAYWGNWFFPCIFLVCLLLTLILFRKQAPILFVCYTVFLLLTVYNPFLVRVIIPKLDFENEYYRFIWILPVIPGVAFLFTKVVFAVKNGAVRLLLAVACVAAIVFLGVPLNGVVENFSMAENLYKIPDDLRAVCDVIHTDSEKENPRVVFDNSLNHIVRQYDPSIQLVINRNVMLVRLGSTTVSTDSKKVTVKLSNRIIDVVCLEKQRNNNGFRYALKRLQTDYLVIPITHTMHAYFAEAGCKAIAQTKDYVVYSFDAQ